jgi:hypothetical protein
MRMQIDVRQIDRRVLDRFNVATGNLGIVGGPYPPRGKNIEKKSDTYHYRLGDFEKTQAVIALLWKYLSEVKREQASAALKSFHSYTRSGPRRGRRRKARVVAHG